MAITDINISEQLETGVPSIKYTGNEGPQNPHQQQPQQQEMMIAQKIWEGLSPEQQGQFQSFEQFFQSGIWKQILQQMQADQGQGQQGIGSVGPRPMEQQMNMPRRGALNEQQMNMPRRGALNGGIMDIGSNGNVRHDFENYSNNRGNVSVPTSFQARPHSDPVNLAYVTPQEQGLLQNLKPGTPHEGPMGIPNYDSFDAAGGYSNPDTGYSASSGGAGGGWRDSSRQDIQQEQQWQTGKDTLKKKLIDASNKGLDAYTLFNTLKGGYKYNPYTHIGSMLLDKVRKGKRQGLDSFQTNFEDDEDETEMTIEQLRDYFQGISKDDLGIRSINLPFVGYDDYMQGKVATGTQPHIPGLEPINTINNPTWNPNNQQFEYNMGNRGLLAGAGHYSSGEQMHLEAPGLDPFGNYGIEGMEYNKPSWMTS